VGRPKHKSVVPVEAAIIEIFGALLERPDYTISTRERKATSKPYREIRVESRVLFDACRDKVVEYNIGKWIKHRVPSVIGTCPKQHIPNNTVQRFNNVCKEGLIIHVPL
jgi:hypothetical protein